jgi:hypothetical protein
MIYWSLASVPELRKLDPDRRERVWKRARSTMPRGSILVTALLAIVGAGAAAALGVLSLGTAGLVFGPFGGALAYLHVDRWRARPYIRMDLERRSGSVPLQEDAIETPITPSCGSS